MRRSTSCEATDVVGNVEIDRVIAVSIDLDVFGMRSQRLEGARHGKWNFGLLRAQEHFDLVPTAV